MPNNRSTESSPRSSRGITPVRNCSPPHQQNFSSDIKVRKLKAVPPKFYSVPHNRIAEEGETVRFQCSVAGHPDPWATWTKDGLPIIANSRITIKEQDDLKILEIVRVNHDDAGIYRVSIENNNGKIEASAKLDIITHRNFSMRSIRARSTSPRPSSNFNRRFIPSMNYSNRNRLDCDFRSSTPTQYNAWHKNVPLLENCDTLEKVQVSTDKVENHENETEAPIFVKELPRVLEVIEGSPLTIQAAIKGTKPCDIIWMKDLCVLPECEDFQQLLCEDGSVVLNLRDVFVQDSGNYRCEVYNTYGEAMSRCRLVVHGKSYIILLFTSHLGL